MDLGIQEFFAYLLLVFWILAYVFGYEVVRREMKGK